MKMQHREVCFSEFVLIRAGCVLEMSASLEATGGWMIDGVCVFLVYLCTCVSLCVYMCMCMCVGAFECLCVQNVFVTTIACSQ